MSESDIALTAASSLGRVLLALRAGSMSSGELGERFPSVPSMRELVLRGFVTGCEDGYRLTDAGRAACPLRNPLAGKAETVGRRSPSRFSPSLGLPVKTATHPPIRRSEKPENTGEFPMSMNPSAETLSAVNQLRGILIEAPEGIARKDLIKRTGLTSAQVDNAISNLIKVGDAERKAYGVVAPIAAGITSMAARMQVRAPVIAVPAAPSNPVLPGADVLPTAAATAQEPAPAQRIDFMLHDDGRLTIDYGDEIFALPPDATYRLGAFLGRFAQPTAV